MSHSIRKSTLFRALLLVLMLSLTFTLASCRMFRRPNTEQGGMPPIPQIIAQGDNQEPQLKVYMHETSSIETMAFEEYLAGVVAAEMEPTWPLEALAAQAIMARTFTLDKIARQGGIADRDAHASTNIEEFQAYDAERVNDNVREAVQNTRGMVLAYQGEFVRTWFSAYCDGMTSNAEDGLAFTQFPTPFITRVKDICPEVAPEEVQNFTATFTKSHIRSRLQEELGQTSGDFSSVEVIKQDDAGRAVTVRIGQATVSAPALRIALGSTELRSTKWSDVTVEGDNVTFTGSGYGHGVGMCQWGAKGMADRGDGHEQIAKHFFPNSQLGKIWD